MRVRFVCVPTEVRNLKPGELYSVTQTPGLDTQLMGFEVFIRSNQPIEHCTDDINELVYRVEVYTEKDITERELNVRPQYDPHLPPGRNKR